MEILTDRPGDGFGHVNEIEQYVSCFLLQNRPNKYGLGRPYNFAHDLWFRGFLIHGV